tara:strand:- start:295 stop:1050 length:756 start_codon:yes stop_codon:yes gene_type:complete
MANPTSRTTLIDYCKRRLGDPVIEINVDPEQIEDRVDEAIQYYQEYNSDATLRHYLKHQVTSSDITNGYIPISSDIIFVSKMFSLASNDSISRNFFSFKYQMMLKNVPDLVNFAGELGYYEQLQQYIGLLDHRLSGTPQIQFQRKMNRLYLFGDFEDKDVLADEYLIAEVYTIVDPNTHTAIYNDMWLKEYTTALIKEQWGQNLIKFDNMQLPGGVVLNGRQIYDDAKGEIDALRERIRLEHEMPPDFFVG